MKPSQKIQKIQLDADPGDSFFILGIVSHDADYKLSLALNKKLGLLLKSSDPVIVPGQNGKKTEFSRFLFNSAVTETTYTLYSNRAEKEHLIQKLNKIDYLLQVYSAEELPDRENLASEIRNLEHVTAVFQVDTNGIKDKNLHFIIP